MSIEPKVKFVDLSRQYRSIKTEVDAAMGQVLDHTDFILGDDVQQFEREFAEYCQAETAVGVDNGTSALELALRALGIGPGDEVLVPVNTFMASSSAISFTGATPVFVDCDPVTYNIDVSKLEQSITPRTRAIMPVHLYGQPADIDPILEIARVHRLYVVEDACQAHGARYKGHRVGSLGHIGAFSFYPGKNLGAYGDGGAIVTNDLQLAERVRILRNCGQREKYNHVTLAYNRRLDTLQAAVLRVKLRYLDQWNSMRRHWALMYNQLLEHEDAGNVTTPKSLTYVEPVHHLYVIRARERSTLQAYMAGRASHLASITRCRSICNPPIAICTINRVISRLRNGTPQRFFRYPCLQSWSMRKWRQWSPASTSSIRTCARRCPLRHWKKRSKIKMSRRRRVSFRLR